MWLCNIFVQETLRSNTWTVHKEKGDASMKKRLQKRTSYPFEFESKSLFWGHSLA
ncbi:hypothetical protein MPTK1_5g14140 [Marchantia polymorpha subsp. ruderalis]|uniref:Uncharacterized protein n=2 Tax=Marchantia polymorpha TaxID=3197 RepID=A0AAF6BI75_MARPO|nr:hypothetical protein MARPO_0032s0105 [Marchantia polymorpha]BBN11709.1 hypothetical protein Mp_5g14140 [Marchantia polymorpha subsp. ruderalis]|eukprot:PTQ41925.1 hypothetical protein MARPO_0032s0105 [Marchantia polymorpha]